MPIHELGYRHWEGPLRAPLLRAWAIARTGIAIAFRGKALRRLMLFAWAPLLYYGVLFFAVGYVTDSSHQINCFDVSFTIVRRLFGTEFAQRMLSEPESIRSAVWSLVFYYFFAYSQSFLTFLIVAIVGPPLISQDVRSKAFLVYFSKPITRLEYLLGKATVLLFAMFLVTLLPALVLYILSIGFSPSVGTLLDTGMTLVRITLASLVIAVPVTALVLFLSSLTRDWRYAAFGWVAIWLLGELAFRVLTATIGLRDSHMVFLVSIRKTTVVLIQSIFDVTGQFEALGTSAELSRITTSLNTTYPAGVAFTALAALTVICFAGLWRRISAPMRI